MGQNSSKTKYATSAKIGLVEDNEIEAGATAEQGGVRTPPKTPLNKDDPLVLTTSSKKKKKKKKHKKHFESSSSSESSSSDESSSDSSDEEYHKRHKKKKKHKSRQCEDEFEEPPPEIDEEDKQLLELLQEYFGFYNTGDEYSDQIVRDTLDKLGPDVLDLPDDYGNTCLLLAAQYGAFDLVPKLINKGVNLNARNKDGACCLHFVCYADTFSPETAQLLVDNGAKPEVVENTYGCTPLHWAASAADIGLCKLLCNAGGMPSTLDNHGCDPIAYASQAGGTECVEFLTSIKRSMGAFSLSAPTPPKGKHVGSAPSFKGAMTLEAWSEQKDEESGHIYFINSETGESMWEAEFAVYKSSIDGGEAGLVTPAKAGDDKRRKSLDATVSKETFEQRLKSMQENMESQLVEQLKSLEGKLSSPGGVVEKGGFVDDTTVELLRGEVAKKELEILKLNRQVLDLQEELEKSREGGGGGAENGDPNDVQVWVSAGKREKMEEEVKSKSGKIEQLNQENMELKSTIASVERQLANKERELENEVEKTASLEEQLKRESAAKEEAMSLLEGGGSGGGVSKEVLEVRSKADAERISQLEADLKKASEKAGNDMVQLSKRLESKEKMLLEAQAKLSSMRDDALSSMGIHEEQLEDMKREHEDELNGVKKELQEQQLLRLSQITELNEAKQAAALGMKEVAQAKEALAKNNAKMAEAQGLLDNNERLHKALAVETERRKALHNKIEDMKGRIRVYVRIRPLSGTEEGKGCEEACKAESRKTALILPDPAKSGDVAKTWDFDSVFAGGVSDGNTQESVFKDTSHLITSAVDGFNVCIFAYGQTGSGKTFTMFGAGGVGEGIGADGSIDPLTGLAPRAAAELFRVLKEREASSEYSVSATMFELYNDALVDLLAPKRDPSDKSKLDVKLAEHTKSGFVEVPGSVEEEVEDVNALLGLFKRGAESRTVASTEMNADSSRSHLITSIVTKVTNRRTKSVVSGKLTLVDLAGSERVGKSGATGQQLKEAQSINKSLSALGDVISALTSGSKHVPYRNHPLTMLMSDSIGGNAKTLMFVCCSPADYNRSESGNSLDFAKRCKDVKNYAGAGGGNAAAQLKALKQELSKLKKGGARPPGGAPGRPGAMRRPGMR
ncbi:hypothetical protein TrVE_jg10844 [Triparma verrucosa]|uniref:Kinesin-like protein n=1 Tax=Triparma verrucosa TaxID=1606542 RepID=A0A9W7EWZ6_9STRA|nr:hypothetical protein TrVE_jg10844 [Triparma verrucosa]